MRMRIFTTLAVSILIGLASVPTSAKTKVQCAKVWRTNSTAVGKIEKAYVVECRGTAVAPAKPEKDYSGSGREGGGGGRM